MRFAHDNMCKIRSWKSNAYYIPAGMMATGIKSRRDQPKGFWKKKSSYSFGIKMLLYRYRQRLKHSRGCVCLIWYLSVFINAVVTVSRFWRLQRTLSLHITAAFFLFVLFHGDVKLKLYVVKWRLSCDKDVTHSISGSFHQKAALLLRARGWNKLRNKINF